MIDDLDDIDKLLKLLLDLLYGRILAADDEGGAADARLEGLGDREGLDIEAATGEQALRS